MERQEEQMAKQDFAKEFLGVGWKFPVEVDNTTGRIKTSGYEEDIEEAIRIILRTRKGERMMMPDFGCGIQDYIFETMDVSSLSRMENEILHSLIRWEPRIADPEVHVTVDERQEGRLNICIHYVVRATNNPYNLVYPYYMNEGFGDR